MNPRRLALFFLAAITILRLLYIGQLELTPDEAYYYQWSERLDGEFSASPVLANGHVYFCGQVGKTYVVKADREYTPIAENRVEDGFMASPAIAGDDLILRTTKNLYCVGKK